MLGMDTVFGILVPDDEEHHIKSVVFRDEEGNSFGPFTKMSSTMDDVNLKTINFPIGLRPPFDEVSHLGRVWRYSVSWYRDPALLDSIILVKSRPRDVTRTMDIQTWTNFQHVAASAHSLPIALYVQVSVSGLGVAGARVSASVTRVDSNGGHQTLEPAIPLQDDGAADPDLTSGDGVYSAYLSPQVRGPGSYSLMVTVTNGDNETFLVSSSPQSDSCCGSAVKTEQSDRVYTKAFVRHVEGHVIIKDTAEYTSPSPRRIIDLEAEYREEEHEVSLGWSVQEGQAERFTLSYSHDIDSVIRGLETRDVVITRVRGQGRHHPVRIPHLLRDARESSQGEHSAVPARARRGPSRELSPGRRRSCSGSGWAAGTWWRRGGRSGSHGSAGSQSDT